MADLKIPYAQRDVENQPTFNYSATKLSSLIESEKQQFKKWSRAGLLYCSECREASLPDRLKVVFPTVKKQPYFAHVVSGGKCAVSKESIHHMKLKIALKEHYQAQIPDDDPTYQGPRPDAILSLANSKIAIEGQTERSKSAYTFQQIAEKNQYYLDNGMHPLWIYISTNTDPQPNNLLKTCLAIQGCIIIYHPDNQTISYRKYSDKTWNYVETVMPVSEINWTVHDKPPNQESFTLFEQLQSLAGACGGISFGV